ncbi:MAG: hypothetical protein QOG89_1674 [Thermomicrobiales bacterium]|nr:hypothetical protein [Thermomicrobiales bacterium]
MDRDLRLAARAFLILLALADAAIVSALLVRGAPPTSWDAIVAVALAGLLAASFRRPLPFGQHAHLTLDTAIVLAAALILPAGPAVLVAGIGPLLANLPRRADWSQAGFNAAQTALQGAVGVGVLAAGGWDRADPFAGAAFLVVVPLAGCAMHIVNALAVATILALDDRTAWWPTWRQLVVLDRTEASGYLAQWGLGLLAVVVADGHAWALALLALPGGVVFGALDRHTRLRLRAEERLVHQAYHDPLTGLPNRARFAERLDAALAAAADQPDAVAVLFLDLDRFKLINDTLGHAAGDALLVEVATRLRACVRPGDTVARLGGDEFIVLLERDGNAIEAVRVAERVAAAMAAPVRLGERDITVSTSIGIARPTPGNGSSGDVLRDADLALYQAKDAGRGRYAVFDPASGAAARERLAIEADLRRALEWGGLRLAFQPKVDLATGRVTAVEALLRWDRPGYGEVGPDAFLPVADEAGLAPSLGRWVLAEACKVARTWEGAPWGGPPVSVNLSERQLRDPALVADVEGALALSGLDGTRLQLEVAESAAMKDVEGVIATLQRLRAVGVRAVLDDFGTGHANLAALGRLPVDALQLDRSFVADLAVSHEARAIVRAVMGLAGGLRLAVVAEGVETPEQLALLRSWGCDAAQGELFASPASGEAVAALVLADLGPNGSIETTDLDIARVTEQVEAGIIPTAPELVAGVPR